MTQTTIPTHFLQHFFADIRVRAELPVLCEKQNQTLRRLTQREVSARVGDVVRALQAAKLGLGDRVALYAAAGPELLIAEWASLASRAVAVIIPRSFSQEELCDTLSESKTKLVFVDRLATAYHLAEVSPFLPDLRRIVCFEGGAHASVPVLSWSEFLDSGRLEPDRIGSLMRAIELKDTALLFYYKDAANLRQAGRYTHEAIMQHVARMDSLLGKACIRDGELVLTATAWEHAIGHIASCYAPIVRQAVVQITHALPSVTLFDNSPQVSVGDAAFFDGLRQDIARIIRHSGQVESFLLKNALEASKMRYEKTGKDRVMARAAQALLDATVIKKVRKLLGGQLRLLIGTDDEVQYDMQLFFHAFGIELIELPQEAFRQD